MFKPRKFLQLSARARALSAVGLLSLIAVSTALAGPGSSSPPPRIPWAVPTIPVGNNPVFETVNQSTHTLYVFNGNDGTISVVDSRRCNAQNASHCRPVATLGPLGFGMPVVDPATDTLYVATGQSVDVVDASTCNAENASGCGQTPTTVSFPGAPGSLALDAATHTLYVGDSNEGPVSFISTVSCNATDTSGCGDTPVQTATGGDAIAIDDANHSVYVTDFNDQVVRVFDDATCNATDTSGCGQTPASLALPAPPVQAAVDEASGTVYVPILSYEPNHPGAVALVNTASCNGTMSSGCASTSYAQGGIIGPQNAIVDPATNTVYVANEGASSISVLDGATCNAHTPNLCPTHPPALAAGFDPGFITLDSQTETIYESSQAMNDVWVLNAAGCNAIKTSGCTRFAPTTTTDDGPSGVVADPGTHTVYANDREANKISVIDTSICNAHNVSGCGTAWPEITVGDSPHASALNPLTHTLYVNNRGDNTLSVIDTTSCNATVTSGCGNIPPTTAVGGTPQQEAVDQATDTVYVANGGDGTVSVVNGAVCNAGDTSGCDQTWPTVTVGANPTAIGLNPVTNTIYVANTNDDTVSVIDGSTCNGGDSSGCGEARATIAVGSDPVSVGVDPNTDTIFVGNSNDGTVSVIDGSTCNGKDTSGCGQTPFAVGVGTPNNEVSLARSIAFDPATQQLFVPVKGDSDVGVIDGNTCRGSNPSACGAKIVPLRMGGFGTFAAVDTSTGTVFVGNNDDGTFSLFPDGKW
jgi:DNA-binding beta-propeller fold protein YncE